EQGNRWLEVSSTMDTIWLEDFLAVLTEGGFSRAADCRAESQPAFSRRIQSLEQWLGAPLFIPGTHSVKLAPAGERFAPLAEDLLRRLKTGRQDALDAAHIATETLRFAATHSLALTFFPIWFRSFERSSSTVASVQLTADHMVACEQLMVEGRAQFLLCHHHPAAYNRLTNNNFRSIEIGNDVLIPVVAPSLTSTGRWQDQPYLAYTSESGLGRILSAAWAASGVEAPAQPVFSSHLAGGLAAMARDGKGVAWSSLSLVADDLAAGRLTRAGVAE